MSRFHSCSNPPGKTTLITLILLLAATPITKANNRLSELLQKRAELEKTIDAWQDHLVLSQRMLMLRQSASESGVDGQAAADQIFGGFLSPNGWLTPEETAQYVLNTIESPLFRNRMQEEFERSNAGGSFEDFLAVKQFEMTLELTRQIREANSLVCAGWLDSIHNNFFRIPDDQRLPDNASLDNRIINANRYFEQQLDGFRNELIEVDRQIDELLQQEIGQSLNDRTSDDPDEFDSTWTGQPFQKFVDYTRGTLGLGLALEMMGTGNDMTVPEMKIKPLHAKLRRRRKSDASSEYINYVSLEDADIAISYRTGPKGRNAEWKTHEYRIHHEFKDGSNQQTPFRNGKAITTTQEVIDGQVIKTTTDHSRWWMISHQGQLDLRIAKTVEEARSNIVELEETGERFPETWWRGKVTAKTPTAEDVVRDVVGPTPDEIQRVIDDEIAHQLFAVYDAMVRRGNASETRKMLRKGADPWMKNSDGQLGIEVAMKQKNRNMQKLLLSEMLFRQEVDPEHPIEFESWKSEELSQVAEIRKKIDQSPAIRHRVLNSELYEAARAGKANVCVRLIQWGADPNWHDPKSGETALFGAVENGHLDLAQTLVALGADSTRANAAGQSPDSLLKMQNQGNLFEAQQWLQQIHHNAKGESQYVVSPKEQQWIDEYRKKWRRLNDEQTASELFDAVHNGFAQLNYEVLTRGANPDVYLMSKWTPLMVALARGHKPIALDLLKFGADPVYAAPTGSTALHMAAMRGYDDIVETILATDGVKPDIVNEYGMSPLHYACVKGDLQSVKLIVARGVQIDRVAMDGTRPLHWAYYANNPQICKLLVAMGADPVLKWNPPEKSKDHPQIDALLVRLQNHQSERRSASTDDTAAER